MSHAIDLSTNGRELKKLYDAVISSDPDVTWAVFKYRPQDTVLAVSASGDGDLAEFTEEFDENLEQYGLVQVDSGTVKKVVLVSWLGEGAPDKLKQPFNTHVSRVARLFAAHQVQITARSHSELSPKTILSKVSGLAGSKYSSSGKPVPATKPKFIAAKDGADEEDWGDVKPIKEREEIGISSNPSTYKPTKASLNHQKDEAEEEQDEEDEPATGGVQGLNSSSSYKPVGKIDLKAIREAGKKDKFSDARVEKIESSYKPVGKIDIAAIRAEARKEEQRKIKAQGGADSSLNSDEANYDRQAYKSSYGKASSAKKPASNDDEDEEGYQSMADRLKAYQSQVKAAKPQYEVSGSGRVSSASTKFSGSSSGARKLPPHLAAAGVDTKAPSISHTTSAFKDFASDGGKTPAQLWAEKHGKFTSTPKSEENDEEAPEVSRLSLNKESRQEPDEEPEEEPEEDEKPQSSFADLTKKFAGNNGKAESEPTPGLPSRQANRAPAPAPVPAAEEPEESESDKIEAIVEVAHEKDPEDDNEISLEVGERITHIEKIDENWWIGRNAGGETGMFPAEYVKVVDAKASSNASAPAAKTSASSAASGKAKSEEKKVAVATYDYDAEDEDELSFKEGDKITNVTFPDADWWSGELKGKIGLFPAVYVELQ